MNYCDLFPHIFSVMRKKRLFFYFIAICLLAPFCLLLQPADAHKVNIIAYAQEGKVYAEGFFVDGSKAKNSVVEVIDGKTGEKLLEGKTDENGQMSFEIPSVTSLKLILRAGTGHQNEYVLSEEEVRQAMPATKKQAERQGEQKKREAPEHKQTKSEQHTEVQKTVNPIAVPENLEAVVGKVVDSRLQPVMKILVTLQEKSEKPGLTEILGGIGYIIGILGIIAYFKGKSRDHNP
jgi:nickel transport protein